ncbi:MAG: hypothetical protein ACK55Z_08235, partial [bacterium]
PISWSIMFNFGQKWPQCVVSESLSELGKHSRSHGPFSFQLARKLLPSPLPYPFPAPGHCG